MKILLDKLVITAFVLSVLIVLGAHFGGRWLYKTDPELSSTPAVSVPHGVFTDEHADFDAANAQEYGVPDSKSPDSDESPSSSEWDEGDWNVSEPATVSEITDEEREAGLRQIRIWKEKRRELEAGLPPLMLSNPEQYFKEMQQRGDRVLAITEREMVEGERLMIEAENLLRRSPDKKDSDVLPQLPDLEPLFLQLVQLRRKVEEARSQYPDYPEFTTMMDELERMEAHLDETERLTKRLLRKREHE